MTTPRVAVALLAGLMFAAAASAAEVRGVVARIDPDKKELTLEERGLGVRGTVLVFTLPDQTPVLFGDQPAAPSDLQVGRRVRVEYTLDDGRQVVQMIHVLGGPKPPPPATATPPIAPISGERADGRAAARRLQRPGIDRGRSRFKGGANGNDAGRAGVRADREERQGDDAGRPQGRRYGDGSGRKEGRPADRDGRSGRGRGRPRGGEDDFQDGPEAALPAEDRGPAAARHGE